MIGEQKKKSLDDLPAEMLSRTKLPFAAAAYAIRRKRKRKKMMKLTKVN